MDLSQKKLTRAEWLNVEIPVSEEEQRVLDLIVEGYHNVNLKKNFHKTIVHEMKLNDVVNIHEYLYTHYFSPLISPLITKHASSSNKFLQICIAADSLVSFVFALNAKPKTIIFLLDKEPNNLLVINFAILF